MNSADESAAFARLIHALRPYRGDLVLIGGWSHRLARLHALAQPVDFPPLFTQDVDLAIARGVAPGEEDLHKLLLEAGFTERFLGENRPPITPIFTTRSSRSEGLWKTSTGSGLRASQGRSTSTPGERFA